jgi:hypothetical protein
MDWDVLDLGHPAVSCTEVALIDLEVQVFGLEEIRGGERDVAVIVSLSGGVRRMKARGVLCCVHCVCTVRGVRGYRISPLGPAVVRLE